MINLKKESNPDLLFNDDRKPVKTLKADVVLGVLRKNCRGLGVCKIVPLHSQQKKCSVTSVVIEKLDDETLRFGFDPNLLCKMQLAVQFSAGVFTLEETFVLPDFVTSALHLEKRLIEKGAYQVVKYKKYYYVAFSLSYSKNISGKSKVHANSLSEFPNMLVPLMPLV